MDFNEYIVKTQETAIYPVHRAVEYCMLGLASEVGEVASVRKKAIRDGYSYADEREKVSKELGDVMWYIAQLLYHYDLDFEQVLEDNISKLQSRKERDKLTGDGDDR
jgi:NTP pyrophosphatase (non-canonical NTP hydrolase)